MEDDKKDFNVFDPYIPSGRQTTRQPYVSIAVMNGTVTHVSTLQMDGPAVEFQSAEIARVRVRHPLMHGFWG